VCNCAAAVELVFLLKTHIVNAYVVPTNSMAPTIVGWHRSASCPACNKELIAPARDPHDRLFHGLPEVEEDVCICTECRKATKHRIEKTRLQTPDRILVSRLATPVRWDLIAFRHPRNPESKYVCRLVGLPGERV